MNYLNTNFGKTIVLTLLLLTLGASGCQKTSEPLHTDYGRAQAASLYPSAGESINGTSVNGTLSERALLTVEDIASFADSASIRVVEVGEVN